MHIRRYNAVQIIHSLRVEFLGDQFMAFLAFFAFLMILFVFRDLFDPKTLVFALGSRFL